MKRNIVLIISLVAGILAAILTRIYLAAKDAEILEFKEAFYSVNGGKVDVLCFKNDVPGGASIAKEDFGYRTVPAVGMRGQAVPVDEVNNILGHKLVLGHQRGDILFWADIEGGNPMEAGLSSDIKRQMRAVSINCTGAASVSGMVKPNDHVDVIGTFDVGDGTGGYSSAKNVVTCTILQNVLVLATGSQTSKTNHEVGSMRGYSTVTLEVTPREAEMLAFAEQMKGRMILSLRNRTDASFERELPQVDFKKIRSEIEELNLKRQQQKLISR